MGDHISNSERVLGILLEDDPGLKRLGLEEFKSFLWEINEAFQKQWANPEAEFSDQELNDRDWIDSLPENN